MNLLVELLKVAGWVIGGIVALGIGILMLSIMITVGVFAVPLALGGIILFFIGMGIYEKFFNE